ncbi:amidohydrolase family protein [Actinomadura syzygii]|uniref:Amidohydrolase family protein n=1 Tax=Actinomadura syzygii TaxID=1427538 RepID=A0A5D0TUF2_9ACTN|nr:amidohydrolase family protein [Actinomadura syzygii]TYC09050.1 amidohydrolase family protein [Actinomadura syzygii]
MTGGFLLRDAELPDGRRADVRVRDGRIAAIAPSVPREAGEEVVECGGGALLPGLVDHHLHLHALAAARRSVRCGPPDVADRAGLAAALAAAVPDRHGWVRGAGYHESVAGDLTRAALDALDARRPVRVQHRSGAMWMLNTRAARAVRLDEADHPGIERDPAGAPTGRIWRADAWLRSRLPSAAPPGLADVGRELARFGVTAVTDATPELTPEALASIAAARRDGTLPQRVHLLGAPLDPSPEEGLWTPGPWKIVLADSGLPAFDDLTGRIGTAHAAGRPVAVHAVTREALVLLLAALREAGPVPGDRIEHAALVPPELTGEIAALGAAVVTQPGFLADRGDDYARDVPAEDRPDLYRCGSLAAAGIRVALSSDAPYGPLDPWAVIAAAVRRETPEGHVLNPAERLPPRAALDACLAPPDDPGGPPRRLRPGGPADLVLLRHGLDAALAEPGADAVRLTVANQIIYQSSG